MKPAEKDTYYHTSPFPLRVAPSQIPNAGLGVFTDATIPAGARIDQYYGTLRDCGGPYALEIRPGVILDAEVWPRCYMAILNDCSYIAPCYKRRKGRRIDITPAAYYGTNGAPLEINCEFVLDVAEKKAYIHAIGEIPAGAELFVAYGKDYWRR